MAKQDELEKKKNRWLYLVPTIIWIFVFGSEINWATQKSGSEFLYVIATYLPIGLFTLVIATYGTESVRLKDFPWSRVGSFIAWMIVFYILLIWTSTQKIIDHLFYLLMIGFPIGAILLGYSIWPIAKKY